MLGKEERLEAFFQLTGCCYNTWNWKYDIHFNVIESNCPHVSLFDMLLLSDGRRKTIEEHMRKCYVPIIYTISAILTWIIAFEKSENNITAIYMKGPFFKGYNDKRSYADILKPLCLDREAEAIMCSSFQSLPMLTTSSIMQFAIMLHYSLNAESISASEVLTYSTKTSKYQKPGRVLLDQFEGTSGYWNIEQELLYKVRNGDLSYRDVIERASIFSIWIYDGEKIGVDYYRQHIHILLTLVSRAAVESGLPRKTSFSLCSEYRRMLNKCYSVSGLTELSDGMLSDYIQRVYEMKKLSSCSSPIRMCCAYIDTHPGEKLSLDFLAKEIGYSVYYPQK